MYYACFNRIHSKAHRGIDFEQLVTGEEVRLVKAWKFHLVDNFKYIFFLYLSRQFYTNTQLN
jgi:hypothetical protein